MEHHQQPKSQESTIIKELFVGLIAMALGVYNLLNQFGVLNYNFEVPQLIANCLLVLVGFILLVTAFRLWRFRYHSKRLF